MIPTPLEALELKYNLRGPKDKDLRMVFELESAVTDYLQNKWDGNSDPATTITTNEPISRETIDTFVMRCYDKGWADADVKLHEAKYTRKSEQKLVYEISLGYLDIPTKQLR